MKKIIVSISGFVIVGMLIATPVHAANTVTLNAATLELIMQLMEKIKVLQAQLELLKSKNEDAKGVTKVQQVDKSEYQKLVAPLMDELEIVQEKIKALEVKIDQKKCQKPNWTYSKGERTFRCADSASSTTAYVATKEVQDLQEELNDLEEDEETIEEKIERLKVRYGI